MSVLKVKKDGVWENVSGTSGHTHTIDDITNFPEIKPDGGNADTVDGKHASDFALASDVIDLGTDMLNLHTLVGDTSVAEQVSAAVSSKADTDHMHDIDDISNLSEALESKYEKPSAGILKTDLDISIQTSLNKADTAVQSLEGYATEDYVNTQVSSLVDSAPETLNTLNELAAALGQDPNFATTVATQIGSKVDKVEGKGLSTNDYTDNDKHTLSMVNDAVTTLTDLVGDTSVANQISDAIATKSDEGHTHSYAGSSSAGGAATSADQLNTDAGSDIQPVYFTNGIPVATSYTLEADVPSNAIFTDTTYSAGEGISLNGDIFSNAGVRLITTGGTNGTIDVDIDGLWNEVSVAGLGSAAYTDSTSYDESGAADAALSNAMQYTDEQIYYMVGDTPVADQIEEAVSNATYTLPTASRTTLGGVKTTSSVTSTSGLTACPIISGVPYYKDTNTTYSLSSFGVTATATELNYVDGVTSNIQTQLNSKSTVGKSGTGNNSAIFGNYSTNTASGECSFVGGTSTSATGSDDFAFGVACTASGYNSVAFGDHTTAKAYQFVIGYDNKAVSSSNTNQGTQSDSHSLFIVGNGDCLDASSNAFRITSSGKCYAMTSTFANGADLAEYFEWLDGNPQNEDRRGKFVTLDGDKIKFANANDEILGVVSGSGAFISNSASENWQGKYITDVFGEKLRHTVEVPESVNQTTGEIIPAHIVEQFVLNPDYNSEQEYISRENRPEWSPVGLVGQLVVVDDGTCIVGGYCGPSVDGVGTSSDNGYKVMKRIDETHIKVLAR